MRLVTLLSLLLLPFSVAYGQTREEQVRFVDGALNRISKTMASAAREKSIGLETERRKAIARDAAKKVELNTLNEAWRAKTGDKELAKLVDAIKATARELALESSVNITSQNSIGTNTTGARVRFQGDDERRNGITPKYSGLTDCTEKNLDIGWYYFWTERSDRETSDKNYGKFIVDSVEKVQLVEDR